MSDPERQDRPASIEVPLGDTLVDAAPLAGRGASIEALGSSAAVVVEELGEPMKLGYADAERIAESRLGTAEVLGIGAGALAALASGALTDEKVRVQAARFLNRLGALEKKYTDLKSAATAFPGYGEWLRAIQGLCDSPSAARDLAALVDGERRRLALADLRVSARVYLQDGRLEWVEHRKMLWQAEQLGLGAEDVEAIYREFPPFPRQLEREAAESAGAGWPPHPLLKQPGEAWAWNLARLRDALLQRFDVAVEVANKSIDHKHSLFAYLEERDPSARDQARAALQAANETGCPQLAVWHFLWATGEHALHVSATNHPVVEGRRQVTSVEALGSLVASQGVLDELGQALSGGLLETWSARVAGNEAAAAVARRARGSLGHVSPEDRASFLRLSVMQALWALGVAGLPLWDGDHRAVMVSDLESLVARSEDCWDALGWCLQSGALAEWLDAIGEKKQAARARECARMTL